MDSSLGTRSFPIVGIYSPAPRSGKTTVANQLFCHHGYQRLSFAEPLKRMAAEFLRNFTETPEQYLRDQKEESIPGLGASARRVLQTLGTEWGRQCIGTDVWVRVGMARAAQAAATAPVVIDDVRFANEAKAIVDSGGYMFRLSRRDAPVFAGHSSEGALETFRFTRTFTLDGSPDSFAHAAMCIAALAGNEL